MIYFNLEQISQSCQHQSRNKLYSIAKLLIFKAFTQREISQNYKPCGYNGNHILAMSIFEIPIYDALKGFISYFHLTTVSVIMVFGLM